jgi:ubiquinone/menaquinone biosynthesis C-methylase UbiE
MSARQPAHTDRRRAESFGATADAYDRYRPRYPQALLTELVADAGVRALDVGAGTGIAATQLLLGPTAREELRSRLVQRIGAAGVDAQNDALAVVCTPTATG